MKIISGLNVASKAPDVKLKGQKFTTKELMEYVIENKVRILNSIPSSGEQYRHDLYIRQMEEAYSKGEY